MRPDQTPRLLTHDERKAADAAFAGRPFDASWSASARSVYNGILAARGIPEPAPAATEPAAARGDDQAAPSTNADNQAQQVGTPAEASEIMSPAKSFSREEAIRAGALVDVTPIAHRMGLRFPVTFSRPLWEIGITAARNVPEEELEGRVRDVLMAFRLKLAASRVTSPLVEFPALLAFPPDPIPRACMLFAVAHQEAGAQTALTFLLPGEVSTGIIPFGAGE